MKNLKFLGGGIIVTALVLFLNVKSSQAQELGRFFWESADKCTYGCYQPGGDCRSSSPWEQVDC